MGSHYPLFKFATEEQILKQLATTENIITNSYQFGGQEAHSHHIVMSLTVWEGGTKVWEGGKRTIGPFWRWFLTLGLDGGMITLFKNLNHCSKFDMLP